MDIFTITCNIFLFLFAGACRHKVFQESASAVFLPYIYQHAQVRKFIFEIVAEII